MGCSHRLNGRLMRIFLVASTLAASLSGCVQPTPPASLLAAADARAKTPSVRSGDAGAGIVTFRPAGPRGWENAPPGGPSAVTGAKP